MTSLRLFILTVSLLAHSVLLRGQDYMDIPRIQDGEMEFDGYLNEGFWDLQTPLDLFITQPVYGGEQQEKSEIFLTYDSKYLYLAGRLFVSDESLIGETGKTRDMMKPNSGSRRISKVHKTFEPVDDLLPRTLTSAQMSAMRINRPKKPPISIFMLRPFLSRMVHIGPGR